MFESFRIGTLFRPCQLQKVPHLQTFETDRLLKGKTDPPVCPFCNGQIRNILPVHHDPALRRGQNPHNHFQEGGFSASVGTGNRNKAILHPQIYVFQDFLPVRAERNMFQFKHMKYPCIFLYSAGSDRRAESG